MKEPDKPTNIAAITDPEKLPRIYQVNWFRKGRDGNFLWPGFGDNSRVLAWIVRRLEGKAAVVDTAIGRRPASGELDVSGLDIDGERLNELFAVDRDTWLAEADLTQEYFAKFGDRLPAEMTAELDALRHRLKH